MPARSGPCRRMRLSACPIERPPGARESANKIRRLCREPLAPRDVDSALPVKPPNHQPGVKPPKVGGLGVTPYPALGPFVLWRREKARRVIHRMAAGSVRPTRCFGRDKPSAVQHC